jgi:hypothetical protein
MSAFTLMSACERLTTPIQPWRRKSERPSSTSRASVPLSIRSSFVSTPMVRSPDQRARGRRGEW